ncbi:hypothetical protein BD769DRAFT_1660556 [Suillus cothurnatus]|nr:hypothetical protein BD769DRAFT_1660556 [Suillus cothurnatus]
MEKSMEISIFLLWLAAAEEQCQEEEERKCLAEEEKEKQRELLQIQQERAEKTWKAKEVKAAIKPVKVVLKGYRIQRASASARMLCPFPEYSPVFQNTICIISKDPDGYGSVSKGPDDYHMISRYRDK